MTPMLACLSNATRSLTTRLRFVGWCQGDDRWRRLSAPSIRLSDSVGCAWMVTARSSAVTAVSMASAASAISSPAPGPTMPTPITRLEAASTISLVSPSLRPMVAARPEAAHENFATLTSRPAGASITPHQATSGSVKTTAGTATLSKAGPARDALGRHFALAHGPVGEHGLAGDVADGVEMRVARPAALVDGHEAPLGERGPGRLETQRFRDGAPADRHQHAVEGLGRLALDGGLDGAGTRLEGGDLTAEVDSREELLAAPGQRLHEIAVHAGEEAFRQLDESDSAAEGSIDLAQLEADVAAAHHEHSLGNVRHL